MTTSTPSTPADQLASDAIQHEAEIAEIKKEVAEPVDWQHPVPLLDQLTPDLVVPESTDGVSTKSTPTATEQPSSTDILAV